nr:hypothetical protein [Herbaspirillum sp. ASV7]
MNQVHLTVLAREDLAYWRRRAPARARQLLCLLRRLRDGLPIPPQRISRLPLRVAALYALRLDAEHYLVVERLAGCIVVHQCRFHY